jgi:hypothetical protein
MTVSTVKLVVGTRTAVTVTGLSTLASATYVLSNDYNVSSNQPLDLLVELEATPGTVSGNKQAVLFAIASNDGTNYSTGPTSGTTTTDEADLIYIGTLPLGTNSTQQRKMFPVACAFGGSLPAHIKFVIKNDSGAAFTAGALYVSEVSATIG